MQTSRLDEIDQQLEALGSVPSREQLQTLVRRHAGDSVTLANADALLATLGLAVEMRPRLQPTTVDVQAPVAHHDAASDEPAFDEPAFDEPAFDEPEPEPEASSPFDEPSSRNSQSTVPGVGPTSEDAASDEPVTTAASARLPWESDSPPAIEPAPAPEVIVPPARSAPDFAALFGEDSMSPEPPRVLDAPTQGLLSSFPPRAKHDTAEHLPAIAPTLASAALFDLPDATEPVPMQRSKPLVEQGESEAPEISLGDGDEFEILVDDEILEIEDDDVTSEDDE